MQQIQDTHSRPMQESSLSFNNANPERVRKRPSPFMGAAGLVLSVGLGVLRIVGKGIKASARLLTQQRSIAPRSAVPKTMKAMPEEEIQKPL
jgi:hypothetical protein